MQVGIAIKRLRKKLNISQCDLAEKTFISQTSLSQIETGIKTPRKSTLKRICDVLGVPQALLYIIALDENDVPVGKRAKYKLIFPSVISLVMEIIEDPSEEGKMLPRLHKYV